MRTISLSDRDQGAAAAVVAPSNAGEAVGFIRGAIRSSPWVVIAVTAHVVGIAALSLMYVKSHAEPPVERQTSVRYNPPDRSCPPASQAPTRMMLLFFG